jgi:hypothetical protein
MNLPKRYSIRGFSAALVEEDNGVMVKYSDYELLRQEFSLLAEERHTTIRALEAENERLKQETNYEKSFLMETDRIHAEFKKVLFDQVIEKNAALEAENERLRKAGDAIKLLHTFGQNLNEAMDNAKANAAKETQP